jgi:hypothetical protein
MSMPEIALACGEMRDLYDVTHFMQNLCDVTLCFPDAQNRSSLRDVICVTYLLYTYGSHMCDVTHSYIWMKMRDVTRGLTGMEL